MAKPKSNRKKPPSQLALDQQMPTRARDPESVRTSVNQDTSRAQPRPGGKLGLIIDHLGGTGATVEELAQATGWQKHSVLGALSRLRSRGFAVRLAEVDGRSYRLDQPEG